MDKEDKVESFFKKIGFRPSQYCKDCLQELIDAEYQRGYEQGSYDQSVTEMLHREGI